MKHHMPKTGIHLLNIHLVLRHHSHSTCSQSSRRGRDAAAPLAQATLVQTALGVVSATFGNFWDREIRRFRFGGAREQCVGRLFCPGRPFCSRWPFCLGRSFCPGRFAPAALPLPFVPGQPVCPGLLTQVLSARNVFLDWVEGLGHPVNLKDIMLTLMRVGQGRGKRSSMAEINGVSRVDFFQAYVT